MRKLSLIAMAMLTAVGTALAIPAHKGIVRMQQPDGGYVSLRLHGDEYHHYTTTDDGYTLLRDQQGRYVYATLDARGQLAPTACVAHEPAARSASERAFLSATRPRLAPVIAPQAAAERQAERARRAKVLKQRREAQYDYSNFRGLVLLVEYNDCSFRYDNYRELMDEMMNVQDYHGNDITNASDVERGYGECTGSARDYYADCSGGQFVPQFDVVGPIKVNRSQYSANGMEGSSGLITAAIDAADSQVNFRDYDGDGDGVVDMVYLVFAGLGSNFSGNDQRLLWPHQSVVWGNRGWVVKDGVYLGRYACGTELYGTPSWSILDGIGTICHEFGHVLGLPDFYDTDYEESGGESFHPGEWTVMAGGGYLNYGRTPAVYTLFERYALGWANPQTITQPGHYELASLDDCNTGYRMDTRVKNEFFMFENRQQVKWNYYLPGHGMLVFRVDSTNAMVWENNNVNANPDHNYFELVRARGKGKGEFHELPTDPFPGTGFVTQLNNVTTPANLLTWSGTASMLGLENITEQDGLITFDVVDVNVLLGVELPASFTAGLGCTHQMQATHLPGYAPYTEHWSSADESVATVSQTGAVTGVAPGTTVITVTCNDSLQAQCLVTVVAQERAADMAAFKALGEGAEAQVTLDGAQVLFASGTEAYLRDASGTLVFSGFNMGVKTSDVVSGVIYGRRASSGPVAQFVSAGPLTESALLSISEGSEPQPLPLYLSEVGSDNYGNLVQLSAITLTKGTHGGMSGMFASDGSKYVRLYNTFGIPSLTAPKNYTGKYYNVKGILLAYSVSNGIMEELALMGNFEETQPQAIGDALLQDDATPVTVHTADGRLVTATTLAGVRRLPLPPGIYIVRGPQAAFKVWRR